MGPGGGLAATSRARKRDCRVRSCRRRMGVRLPDDCLPRSRAGAAGAREATAEAGQCVDRALSRRKGFHTQAASSVEACLRRAEIGSRRGCRCDSRTGENRQDRPTFSGATRAQTVDETEDAFLADARNPVLECLAGYHRSGHHRSGRHHSGHHFAGDHRTGPRRAGRRFPALAGRHLAGGPELERRRLGVGSGRSTHEAPRRSRRRQRRRSPTRSRTRFQRLRPQRPIRSWLLTRRRWATTTLSMSLFQEGCAFRGGQAVDARARLGMKTRRLGVIGECEARELVWGRRGAG